MNAPSCSTHAPADAERLPLSGLLALAAAGFITILTEALPAGLLPQMAGYASRMVASHLQGRAIAVAMLGAPLALSLGIPLGTFLGSHFGWRLSFALMTGLTLLLIGWVRWQVPDFAGQNSHRRPSLLGVVRRPGVQAVLWVTARAAGTGFPGKS